MKQHLKALAVVLVVGALCAWGFMTVFGNKEQAPANYASIEVMQTQGVPNFTTKDLAGSSFDLQSLKGKVVIVNFWASWCTPCIEEVPSLIKLVKEFKGQVELIAISGDSSRNDIDVFLKSFPELKGENIKIVYDEDRSLMKQFQIARLPESLVLGPDQKLAKKLVGSIDWYNKDSIAYVNSLLGNK